MPVPCAYAFEAVSRDESIVAAVGPGGESLGVRLGPGAMECSDAELATRIVKLMTLAHLRAQLALRRELEVRHSSVSDGLATQEQVCAFEALIDF